MKQTILSRRLTWKYQKVYFKMDKTRFMASMKEYSMMWSEALMTLKS